MSDVLRAEVISIGDELTSGQRLDTNSQWLSNQLGELGVRTMFHTTVSDDLDANIAVFRIAASRVELVVCTGGLGPTADDLTRQAIADAFDRPLEMVPEALEHIESLFARRHRAMPERNRVQAYFPRGSLIIPNPHGSAPGIDLRVSSTTGQHCRIFALPGVPAEMTEMWYETVVQRLRDEHGLGKQKMYYHTFKLFGLGESDVEAKIPDLISRHREPRVGITASRATITLRVATPAESEAQSQSIMKDTVDLILTTFGDFVFGTGEQELPDVILEELERRGESLGVLEIGDEGVIGNWFSERKQQGSDRFVKFVKCYPDLDSALQEMSVARDTTDTSSSLTTMHALAQSIRRAHAIEWVMVAGPYPSIQSLRSQDDRQEESFGIAIDGPTSQSQGRRLRPSGHPDLVLHRIAKQALDDLRRLLKA